MCNNNGDVNYVAKRVNKTIISTLSIRFQQKSGENSSKSTVRAVIRVRFKTIYLLPLSFKFINI